MGKLTAYALMGVIASIGVSTASAGTLDTVKQKGFLQCGLEHGAGGFWRSR